MTIDSLEDVSDKRWEIAQSSEKNFWEDFTTESLKKQCNDFYSLRVGKFQNLWKKYILLTDKTKILQIGCGPLDVINYVTIGKKFAIDPLADYYKKKFKIDYSKIKFIDGVGENLPFKDKEFDIVLLLNVLDHVQSSKKVLSECRRVLKDNGIFQFENNVYSKRFFLIAKGWNLVQRIFFNRTFNIHHPYMFEKNDAKKFLSEYFLIDYEDTGERIGNETLTWRYKKIPLTRKFRRIALSVVGVSLENN